MKMMHMSHAIAIPKIYVRNANNLGDFAARDILDKIYMTGAFFFISVKIFTVQTDQCFFLKNNVN